MGDEETSERQRKALEELAALRPPHPTDGMTPEERDAYYEERRRAMWEEAHEIEARVPGLDWGSETPGSYPSYGNGCPWQAEGHLGHRPFYGRLRGNMAALTIYGHEPVRDTGNRRAEELESAVIAPFFEGERALDGYAGDLYGVDEIVEFFRRLIPRLAPVSEENPSHYMILSKAVEEMVERMGAAGQSEVED